MTVTTRRPTLLLLALALVASACSQNSTPPEPQASEGSAELAIAVASYDLAVGTDRRFIAGVLTPQRGLIGFGEVQMDFAFLGADPAVPARPGPSVRGPWLAVPGLEPDGAFDQPTLIEQAGAAGVYQTRVDFDTAGLWTVDVTATTAEGQLRGSATFAVGERFEVPAVGDPAPLTDSLTLDSPIEPAAIDSRAASDGAVPDPELHSITIADAVTSGLPTVVVFSTPVFCVSRFCGPITDTISELAGRHEGTVNFVHVEVWKDFEAETLNDAAAEWIVTEQGGNEPWVFLIGADGRIDARWDNVLDLVELESLLNG